MAGGNMTAIETMQSDWGVRAADWAEIEEPCSEPLYEAAFAYCRVGKGARVLDVGCGAGRAAQMAAERGASMAGLDASAKMIEIAKRRTPSGDFRVGDMQELPWPSQSFDLVTGFKSFQFATSPIVALREAARVTRPRGCIAIAAWGDPERSQATIYMTALRSLAPSTTDPWSFSAPTALRDFIEAAGLKMTALREVVCASVYRDADVALRGLTSAGPIVRAMDLVGEARVRDAIVRAIEPLRRRDGSYRIENHFRIAVAEVEA
jgi:SAM-dependent methyltransferase